MSSKDYSVNDFGYVFNAEMIDKIIEKVKPKNIQTGDTYEMAEIMGLQYIGEFTGEAIRLDEVGDDDFRDDAWSYSADSIFYFPIGAYSSLFKAAYQSKEELALCMKSSYRIWLPDDLDEIYNGIRHIDECKNRRQYSIIAILASVFTCKVIETNPHYTFNMHISYNHTV